MLQFHYDFRNKFVDRSDMNMMYMDTDSCYMAITAESFDEIIKPEMKEIYEKEKYNWFPRTDTEEHLKYDTRTPGLFKVEFSGSGMVCLASKLYYCISDVKNKLSSKGTQKDNNNYLLNYKNFKQILFSFLNFINITEFITIFKIRCIN